MVRNLLDVAGLEVAYGRSTALRGISFGASAGSLIAILGRNGAGKTTLMRAIAGSLPLRAGSICVDGRNVSRLPSHRRLRLGISLVPEGRGMLPAMTVLENLELGAYARSVSDRRANYKSDLEQVLVLFPVLNLRLKQPSGHLSGGEMQMLAIARALMSKPKLLLLDEPTLGLSPMVSRSVVDSIAKMTAIGLTVVVVEQRAVGLLELAERVLILQRGQIQAAWKGSELTRQELVDLYFRQNSA